MRNINQAILEVLSRSSNIITTSQVIKLGFSKQILTKYVNEGLLVRVRQGVYILPDSIHDDIYTLMLRSESIIFSHESALFLHGLSERTPFKHSITLPSNKTIPSSIKNECVYFYVKPEWHKIGLTERKTTFGNLVRCYDLERTICDLLRTRVRCDEETIVSALKSYALCKEKDLNKLSTYSEIFKLTKELKNYLEVLL